VTAQRRIGDQLAVMEHAAGRALEEADLIVVTGGASVGDRDFAKAMFEPHGLHLIFSKVAIKPGKPVWFGRAKGKLVLGLPGNPTSALVTARLFLGPLLSGLAGRDPAVALAWRHVPLAHAIGPVGDRETFARARLESAEVSIAANQDSGGQRTLADCNLLVRLPAGSDGAEAGTLVGALDF
jgi:molybdopterin molybdotransferase